MSNLVSAKTIRVPTDKPTIQAAVNSAENANVVLIAPGVYKEKIKCKSKTIIPASYFLNFQDPEHMAETVLDGCGKTVLSIEGAGPETKVVGLTIHNGDDGISTDSKIQILHNYFTQNEDAIDLDGLYEVHNG